MTIKEAGQYKVGKTIWTEKPFENSRDAMKLACTLAREYVDKKLDHLS